MRSAGALRHGLAVVLVAGLVSSGASSASAQFWSFSPAPKSAAAPAAMPVPEKPEVKDDGQCNMNYRAALKSLESGGNYAVSNKEGHSFHGAYQMGKKALIETGYMDGTGKWLNKGGIDSLEKWKNSPAEQERAQVEWEKVQDNYVKHLYNYVGKDAPGCSGTKITKEGIRGMAHLVGQGGAESYLKSGGVCGKKGFQGLEYSTVDGSKNPTCAGKYLCMLSGCKDIEKDYNKRTCDVTMPMIEGIQCSNFPAGELRTLCEQARPHLMTRGECESAESWAQRAPKGPNKEACENLTFGPGTGSWSFVLACSYAKEAPADHDGKPNPNGPVSDPECISKLKALGVDFKVLGQVNNGAVDGKACFIENAITYRGGAIKFPGNFTMTCETALAMERFGQTLTGMGVTGYANMGSTSECRNQRDNRGSHKGTVSAHGLGRAVDIKYFIWNGEKVDMGEMLKTGTPESVIANQVRDAACSNFGLVLSPYYERYRGAYTHMHVEVNGAAQRKCR